MVQKTFREWSYVPLLCLVQGLHKFSIVQCGLQSVEVANSLVQGLHSLSILKLARPVNQMEYQPEQLIVNTHTSSKTQEVPFQMKKAELRFSLAAV